MIRPEVFDTLGLLLIMLGFSMFFSLGWSLYYTENDLITMSIQASVQAITGYVGAERRPIVSSRSTDTNVMVRNGETLMIGGLIFDQDDSTIEKLPYLGDLPFFGRFFLETPFPALY